MITGGASLILSAFLHATWNAGLKRERDSRVAMLGVLSFTLVFTIAAAITWPEVGFATRAAFLWSVAAGVCEGLYFATLALAMARADYGAVYALTRGGALLVVWPAGALLFGEAATRRSLVGAAFVAIGLGMVGLSVRGRSSAGGIAYALACAGSIAGYHLCFGRALAEGTGNAPLFAVALTVALPFAWASVRLGGPLFPAGGRAVLADGALRWCVSGLVATASFLLFLAGLAHSGAGLAMTLRNTSIVFAQGLALLMGERVPRRQLIGSGLVVAGAALAALR